MDLAHSAFGDKKHTLRDRQLTMKTKLRILNRHMYYILKYERESWPMTTQDERRIRSSVVPPVMRAGRPVEGCGEQRWSVQTGKDSKGACKHCKHQE